MPPRRWGAPLGWGLAVLFRFLKATKALARAVAATAGPRSVAAPRRSAGSWVLPGLCLAWWAQAVWAQGARTEAVGEAAAASAPAAAVEAAPAPVPLPPPPVVHAFQGLPWGASEAQIAQRFGGQLQQAQCAPVSRRQPERTREDRFASAGLAGNHGHARRGLDLGRAEDDEVIYLQPLQHA